MRNCGICECSEELPCVGGCAWLSRAEINLWLLPVADKAVNICTRCRTIFEVTAIVLGAICAGGNRATAGSFLGLTQQIREGRGELSRSKLAARRPVSL